MALASQYFDETKTCLEERVLTYPAGEDFAAFAGGLGPCVNVYLLGKTDQEIAEAFRPGSGGSFLYRADGGVGQGSLFVTTVGAGSATAGAWSEHYTIIVCWEMAVDFSTRTIAEISDATCKPEVVDSWSKPRDVITLADLKPETG